MRLVYAAVQSANESLVSARVVEMPALEGANKNESSGTPGDFEAAQA